MSTGTEITPSQQTLIYQLLASGLSAEQLTLFAQGAENRSGANSDPEMVRLWLLTRGKGKLRTLIAYCADVSEFFQWLGGATVTTLEAEASIHNQKESRLLTYITGGKPIRSLTATDLVNYNGHLAKRPDYSPATQTRKLSAVRSLLSYAQKTGYSTFNVGSAVKPTRGSRGAEVDHKRILSREQVLSMIVSTPKERDRFLIRFLYVTGCRVGEALSLLTWADVSFQPGAVVISLWNEKKAERRRVTLTEKAEASREVVAMLRKYRAEAESEAEPVFKSQKGGALDASQAFRIVRAAAQRAGVPGNVSPHWLRHCHVAHALNGGAPVHVVQKTVGHSSLDVTSGYADLLPGQTSADYL